ncbi:hypothetical protein Ddye_021965 [Dipteronia dyeriana]|uniref:Reverse transcriptase zinc-binding domain-containing protein n=1 Tax=Dipteronia dyeriana TaxID=168575 RepID=A0AAD9WYH4_9ROSI|nr:hypothetical protein Ddye_021965 [Dipteronia dyeriana]
MIRCGYHLGVSHKDSPSSSGLSDMESSWKFLWRIKVPTKVKIFLWKACHNLLPTHVNLAKRELNVDVLCPFHHAKPETTMHALWNCSSL